MNSYISLLMMRKTKVNHILHLLLSILTAGLWLIVWFLVVIFAMAHNSNIDAQIDDIMEAEVRRETKTGGATQ